MLVCFSRGRLEGSLGWRDVVAPGTRARGGGRARRLDGATRAKIELTNPRASIARARTDDASRARSRARRVAIGNR